MNNRLAGLILLVVAALACGQQPPVASPAATSATPTPVPGTATAPAAEPVAAGGFIIGIEYGLPGLSTTYAAAGLTAVKPAIEFATWGNIEPSPGQFNWGPLDNVVLEYQSAGFTYLQLLLSANSSWASRAPNRDLRPKDEYVDDYINYVTAVVERYDGDGVDDAPGLLSPIHYYGVEHEFSGFFPGPAEDYLYLLRLAYPVIHAADPDAQVMLVALLLNDVFDGAPDAAEVERRLGQTPGYRKSLADMQAILAACDVYDLVDFHSLGHYTEIPPTADWLRAQLNAAGCDRPIFVGDAFPMSPLLAYNARPFAPATADTKPGVLAALQAVADPADPAHAAAWAWLEAEVARGLVKKIVVSAGAGLAGINIGNQEDWNTRIAGLDQALVLGLGASAFMGLGDVTITNERPGGILPFAGEAFGRRRKPGDARAGYAALELVAAQLSGYTTVERLDLGDGVWAYHFDRAAGPVWVLWYDDGGLALPGEALYTTTVSLSIVADRASVTRTPTGPGAKASVPIDMNAPGGLLSLTLDSTPVFVSVP